MNQGQIFKFLELLPVLGFGVAYWRFDLHVATIVLMAFMSFFIVAAKLCKEPLTRLQVGTWLVIMFLGAATLWSRDELFIKWKTTVINLVLALVFAGSHVFGNKTIAERLLAAKLAVPGAMLRKLNGAAVLYFLLVALLNLFVAYRFDTTVWVNFKLFGLLALNFLFFGGSVFYLRAYLKEFFEKMEK